MISKQTFASATLGATALLLLLVGCSTSSTSNVAAGTVSESSTASSTPAPTNVSALPFNAGGYLAGNASPKVDAGEAGKVSVVATAPLDSDGIGGGTLSFAFRNNTSAPVSHVDFTGTAAADGKIVASGSSQGTIPAQLKPGEAGFGYIYFEDVSSIPASGAQYDFKASTMPASTSSYNTAPLNVTQAENNGTSIIGAAVNKTGKPLAGPYSVGVYCFAGDALATSTIDYATETGDIDADGTVSFSHDLFDEPCDTFAIGVSGYFQ